MSRKFSDNLINYLKKAQLTVVLTGAGVSAESGVPTFRDKDGLWNKFNPAELANMEAFLNNPELVWEWYRWRQNLISSITPNPGHYALAELEEYLTSQGKEFYLITQNVDGLHRKAGSKNILELHGNIMRNKCLKCDYKTEADFSETSIPKCPECNNMLRPAVVWFGEMLPAYEIRKAFEISEKAHMFLSIGTSALVYPAAMLPVNAANNYAYTVEINLERSVIADQMDEVLLGKSGEILPELVKKIFTEVDF